jgi:uncharacterized cupredoxin-like copper-binding protein
VQLLGRVLAGATIAIVTACGGETDAADATPHPPINSTVQVTLADFSVSVAQSELPYGDVTFAITNNGPTTHELEVFSVPDGVDADKLPVVKFLALAASSGLEIIDEQEFLQAGSTSDLTVSLAPARYALLCNMPNHYGQGMHTTITIR